MPYINTKMLKILVFALVVAWCHAQPLERMVFADNTDFSAYVQINKVVSNYHHLLDSICGDSGVESLREFSKLLTGDARFKIVKDKKAVILNTYEIIEKLNGDRLEYSRCRNYLEEITYQDVFGKYARIDFVLLARRDTVGANSASMTFRTVKVQMSLENVNEKWLIRYVESEETVPFAKISE